MTTEMNICVKWDNDLASLVCEGTDGVRSLMQGAARIMMD